MTDKKLALEEEQEEELDLSPFWAYMQTEQGHRIAEKLIELFEAGKKSSLLNSGKLAKLDKYLQFFVILAVIVAVTALTYVDKFTPSLGVLFGSLVGYIYGRKQ